MEKNDFGTIVAAPIPVIIHWHIADKNEGKRPRPR